MLLCIDGGGWIGLGGVWGVWSPNPGIHLMGPKVIISFNISFTKYLLGDPNKIFRFGGWGWGWGAEWSSGADKQRRGGKSYSGKHKCGCFGSIGPDVTYTES